jgi:hypothetical protein
MKGLLWLRRTFLKNFEAQKSSIYRSRDDHIGMYSLISVGRSFGWGSGINQFKYAALLLEHCRASVLENNKKIKIPDIF